MDNYGIIGGIVILAILIFIIAVELRKSADKKNALEFLQGLGDKILEVILDTINSASPEKFHTLVDFQNYLLEQIYNNVWDYLTDKVNSDSTVDSITKIFFKYIDKDTLTKFINEIIEKNNLNEKVTNIFVSNSIESTEKTIVDEDNKLAKEYSDTEKYNENVSDKDLEPAEELVPSDDEIAAINPQKDEEEDYNANDVSMELVEDDNSKEILHTVSKSGQDLYYELNNDGKKKRVSKDYAVENMKKVN